jgi:hypothetical protein
MFRMCKEDWENVVGKAGAGSLWARVEEIKDNARVKRERALAAEDPPSYTSQFGNNERSRANAEGREMRPASGDGAGVRRALLNPVERRRQNTVSQSAHEFEYLRQQDYQGNQEQAERERFLVLTEEPFRQEMIVQRGTEHSGG